VRDTRVCDSSRAECPKCGKRLHGVRVDVGSTWARCEGCSQRVYLLGCLGGVTFSWAIQDHEFNRLSNAGMLPRDVLTALQVIERQGAAG
jgi:hypothetical protein